MTPGATFFVGLGFRGPLEALIREARAEVHRRFGCRSGMHTPPHITLVPPFDLAEGARPPEPSPPSLPGVAPLPGAPLAEALDQALAPWRPLPSLAMGEPGRFGFRTIWFAPESAPWLLELQQAISRALGPYGAPLPASPFVPHLTLANRDIPRDRFDEVMAFAGSLLPLPPLEAPRLTLYHWDGAHWIPGRELN